MRAVTGSLGHSPKERHRELEDGRPSPGLLARLGVPVGGRVRKSRAVRDSSGPASGMYTSKLERIIVGHSLWPCLGQGASLRARVEWVRRTNFLSILRDHAPVMLRYWTFEAFTELHKFPQPASDLAQPFLTLSVNISDTSSPSKNYDTRWGKLTVPKRPLCADHATVRYVA
jgi:hypothetical protein